MNGTSELNMIDHVSSVNILDGADIVNMQPFGSPGVSARFQTFFQNLRHVLEITAMEHNPWSVVVTEEFVQALVHLVRINNPGGLSAVPIVCSDVGHSLSTMLIDGVEQRKPSLWGVVDKREDVFVRDVVCGRPQVREFFTAVDEPSLKLLKIYKRIWPHLQIEWRVQDLVPETPCGSLGDGKPPLFFIGHLPLSFCATRCLLVMAEFFLQGYEFALAIVGLTEK